MKKYKKCALLFVCVFWLLISSRPVCFDDPHTSFVPQVLARPRGGGYWVWKPLVVREMLRTLRDGDVMLCTHRRLEFSACRRAGR